MDLLLLFLAVFFVIFLTLFAFIRRYKRCPSDKILVVYGKISGGGIGGLSAKCYHGGAAFVWPVIQAYRYLDLTPMTIDIKLEGALSKQNIRVNTPSTFTIGVSTEPGVMENAAERMLDLDMQRIADLARDLIFGQMRVVLATMPIEEINADRDKLIENITSGVEVELKKVGLRLINVNIQDITDESGYIDALGKEAAARAINEAKVKVAEKERDGSIGAANAERDQRIQVAEADATAVEGENTAKITIAQSNALRREQEAEAERAATAAEKVKSAQALQEAYGAEELAERQRAQREQASQYANIVVPAEIEKQRIETLAEADAEKTRRTRRGEADGLRSVMEAEAEGLKAILTRKAEGFGEIVAAACGQPELASLLLVTEQLPKLVEEQVKAISNLKIDKVTVWEGGRQGDKTATADFLSGLVGSLPPLHELTKNVGVRLPEYLGSTEKDGEEDDDGDDEPPPEAAPGGGGARTRAAGAAGARRGEAGGARASTEEEPGPPEIEPELAEAQSLQAQEPEPADSEPPEKEAAPVEKEWEPGEDRSSPFAGLPVYEELAYLLERHPLLLAALDRDRDGRLSAEEIEGAVHTAMDWAQEVHDARSDWYFLQDGKPVGPRNWWFLRELAERRDDLLVAPKGGKSWLPFHAVQNVAEHLPELRGRKIRAS